MGKNIMQIAKVEYQIGTYSGSVDVFCDENDDNDFIIAKAKRTVYNLSGNPTMPMYYEHWNIVERKEVQDT